MIYRSENLMGTSDPDPEPRHEGLTPPRAKMEYKFQFNNDPGSCIALRDLIMRGWTVQGFIQEDGYTWFLLIKETE